MARFARRKRVGLGAGGGRGGAITGLRRRTQRLSDGGARRLRVRLHEDQRGDAAGIGEVLLLHRHDRIDPALRSLCRSRNLLEHSAGAGRFRTMFQSPAPIAARERPGHYGTAMIFKLGGRRENVSTVTPAAQIDPWSEHRKFKPLPPDSVRHEL